MGKKEKKEVGKKGEGIGERRKGMPATINTAARRLPMRQVEHFRSLFQSLFPVRSQSPVRNRLHSVCSLCFSCSASRFSCFLLFCSY